jgi:hypothetical protein
MQRNLVVYLGGRERSLAIHTGRKFKEGENAKMWREI